jgi:hypothetical protein
MSEPSAITGLPDPHVATQAVGIPDWPRVTLKPNFSSCPVRYFEVSTSCMPSSPKLNTESTISCASLASSSTPLTASCFCAVSRGLSGAGASAGAAACAQAGVVVSVSASTSAAYVSRVMRVPSAIARTRQPQTPSL